VLDACRYFAGLLVGALRGASADEILPGVYEPVAGLWAMRPLKPEMLAALARKRVAHDPLLRHATWDVLHAVANARAAASVGADVGQVILDAVSHGREPALDGALAGALAGALQGASGLAGVEVANLARLDLLEQFAVRLAEHASAAQAVGAGA
jgi:hypothetical protein